MAKDAPSSHFLCLHLGAACMPKAKRERRERTDNYHLLQQWCRTPEQRLYEGIRPIPLFGVPPAERAQETGLAERSLGRAAAAFDTHGMISLFRPTKAQREDHHRSLPVAMRQLIVDLKAEYPAFTEGEIAAICAIQFSGRRPSHHTVKAVLADGPPPSRTGRQFQRYDEIAKLEERGHAVIRLHAASVGVFRRLLAIWMSHVQRFMSFSSDGSRKGCRAFLINRMRRRFETSYR